jgi:hypothetical protein
MNPQVNWAKIKAEINKLADLDHVKTEVKRIAEEIRKFDINKRLSPTAKQRLKNVESKYHEVTSRLNRTQRQIDREFNRVLRFLNQNRSKAKDGLDMVKQTASDQRRRLKRVGDEIRNRVLKTSGTKRKSSRKKGAKTKSTT